jgi:hypothetical protein
MARHPATARTHLGHSRHRIWDSSNIIGFVLPRRGNERKKTKNGGHWPDGEFLRIQYEVWNPRIWIAIAVSAIFPFCLTLSAAAQTETQQQSPAAAVPQSETQQQSPAAAVPRMEADPTAGMLDSGFRHLYELDFAAGRSEFQKYQELRPDDPFGKAAEAASHLFEQFNQKGVLTSAFFCNDSKFLNGIDGNPADNRNPAFLDANHKAREAAKGLLARNPKDPHALLVLTMVDGMEADYDTLIEKKQLAGLSMVRQAEAQANTVLSLDPTAGDANVALGAGNYIIGSLPGYKRAFIWFGGIHGDKQRGMDQMQNAIANGHYFRPFAKILLALAYEREHQPDRARALLSELAIEFPANPLFAHELALLDQQHLAGKH